MSFENLTAAADVRIIGDRKHANVEVQPQRKKVAIVGFASNSLHLVPWFDPEYEIWGMNQGHINFQRRADRWFEMHSPEFTADVRDPQYIPFLQTCPVPIYMIDAYEAYPNSVRYPIEDAIEYAGRDYFTSSVAFMLAIAGMEGFKQVDLYGINLAIGDEYFYEKPCAEWWLGKLEAKGINIFVPHASSLLKQYRRYGYYVDRSPGGMTKVLLQARINEYRGRAEKLQGELNVTLGAMREAEALIQIAEGLDHGADIVLAPQFAPAS
jgi:hypothetical protein